MNAFFVQLFKWLEVECRQSNTLSRIFKSFINKKVVATLSTYSTYTNCFVKRGRSRAGLPRRCTKRYGEYVQNKYYPANSQMLPQH